METFYFWVNLLLGLLSSEICLRSSFAFPQTFYSQHASPQRPELTEGSEHTDQELQKAPSEDPELVNTVRVSCYPDSLDIIIKADMFGVGAPVNSDDIRLGVEHDVFCTAAPSSVDEYRITVGLSECGTKHWMTEDSLVYTNLLIYSPEASPDGLIRMEEAVVPIECHYERSVCLFTVILKLLSFITLIFFLFRKYSLSSLSIAPTWIPYMSTQAAVETLEFDLRIMTNDWTYERSSKVFHLGEPISIEASVRIGHHMGLRVFVSSCVATLSPDIYSVPRYIFIENGCLVDSQLPGSKSHFLPRIQDDKLHLVIDAFRFHNEDRGELYVTCHMNAVPTHDTEALNKACTFVNGRWRSADGNDYLCGQCQNQNEVSSKSSSAGTFGPRGFKKLHKSESWKSAVKNNIVWEQEAKLGPVLVLPGKMKSGPLPEDELPPVLGKISRPALYGSQWRSGLNNRRVEMEKGLTPDPSEDDYDEEEEEEEEDQTLDSELKEDLTTGADLKGDDEGEEAAPAEKVDPADDEESEDAATVEKVDPVLTLKSKAKEIQTNSTAAPSDVSLTVQSTTGVTIRTNGTETGPAPTRTSDPKR
ncbi:zona pellucida sperm-binding protein 3-like isoform X2 [Xyrichtys novacula]|uniref:Zona pellucida sperm-binding protein 3 n=1 Tax=Xyrichtys novacula TaxID=13765 RepID=A0AAV1GUX8_XYRNO|nr:zona pellucida sperm-binding protein 3-like isoform X2 [Xyrichtys novacula]